MSPLMITIAFLSLLGIMTTSEVRRYFDHSYVEILHKSSKDTQHKAALEIASAQLEHIKGQDKDIEEIKPTKPEKKEPTVPKRPGQKRWRSLNFSEERPPNNSFLNFRALAKNGPSDDPLSLYQIAARLLRALYGQEPFFRMRPQMEYRLLDEIIARSASVLECHFPDDLANLIIQDEILQKALYQALKGCSDEDEDYPSLLYYITLEEKEKKINFMFAPQLLLEVIFEDHHVLKPLLEWRTQMLKVMKEQEETHQADDLVNRTDIKNELKTLFDDILEKAGKDPKLYRDLFDLSLSEKGHVIFITDEKSGRIIREKIRFPR